MEQADERLSLLALSHVSFLTPREKLVLIEMLGGAQEVFSLTLAEMAGLLGRRFTTRVWEPERLLDRAAESEKILTQGGIGCIFYWDRAYPPQLREIYDPPATLFSRGYLPDNGKALIAIVGTRLPTGGARKAAFSLGYELGARGVGVVSGLARGIDREAHEGCVEAGGYSVAVLGSGIDSIYPSDSRAAAARILSREGIILSEYPPGTPPLRHNFPARNRIISGMSRSVVVVQAPEKSGALITAEYALEQGRDLLVHRVGIEGAAAAGTRRLVESGAPVIEGALDVLREWGEPDDAGYAQPHSSLLQGSRRFAQRNGGSPRATQTEEIGAEIARIVAAEIAGSCTRSRGQILWRE